MHCVFAITGIAAKYAGWIVNKDVDEPGPMGELLASKILGMKYNNRPAGDKRTWVPAARDEKERTVCWVVSGKMRVVFSATEEAQEASEYIVDAGHAFSWRDEGHMTEALEHCETITVRWSE